MEFLNASKLFSINAGASPGGAQFAKEILSILSSKVEKITDIGKLEKMESKLGKLMFGTPIDFKRLHLEQQILNKYHAVHNRLTQLRNGN